MKASKHLFYVLLDKRLRFVASKDPEICFHSEEG
jgi:hypothetical protein